MKKHHSRALSARRFRFIGGLLACMFVLFLASKAVAYLPEDGQMTLQKAATPIMRDIHHFYDFVLIIMFALVAFIGAILVYTMLRFNRRNNPVPSKRSHNALLEVIWTIIPVIVIVIISIPSYKLLHKELVLPQTDMTVKVTAHQWYWTYEYPDGKTRVSFDSNITRDDELPSGKPRLLTVDNPLVVPIHKKVRVIVTSTDVVHSFSVPAFGVKIDAVPGRLNETWFDVEKEGVYYGQCSQLCGTLHAFMPIEVHAVSEGDYQNWLVQTAKNNS